jgi:hypothetical protein
MDKATSELMDRVVKAILMREPDDLRRKSQQKAAHVLNQGVSGSPFAWGQHVMMHYEHLKEYSKAVCDAMLQVAQDAERPVEAGTAAQLKAQFDIYMEPLVTKTRTEVAELVQMLGGQPSKPTFDEVQHETRTQHHNEIDLWARKQIADQKREANVNVIYNLTGPNPKVNINSIDYSLTIQNAHLIFESLREAIQKGVTAIP